jgi:Acetyltransferase (isoleucine patch superfamily)
MDKVLLYRLWHTARLYLIPGSGKRADYIRDHHIFYHVGNDCTVMERKIPLCPQLISLGDNVHLASKVFLIPHDAIHLCLNNLEKFAEEGDTPYKEKIGCIEIGDNVFIGSNTTVLYDVRIGSNVIVGAGSLVNRDIPDNSVAVGTPARVIGTFDDFIAKRRKAHMYPDELAPVGHQITKELEDWCWNDFHARKD